MSPSLILLKNRRRPWSISALATIPVSFVRFVGAFCAARAPFALLLLVATLTLGAPDSVAGQSETGGIGLPAGTPAPDVQVEDLEGNPVSLLDVLGGGPALLEFWASWCEQCEALQPQLDQIRRRFAGKITVVAVAVAVGQSRRRVRRHVDEHAPAYPYVYDASGAAVRAYQASTTSIVVLVDREGRVVSTGVGADQDLVRAVEALLGTDGDGSGRSTTGEPPGEERLRQGGGPIATSDG